MLLAWATNESAFLPFPPRDIFCPRIGISVNRRAIGMRDQRLAGGTGRHAASITARSVGRDQSIGNVQVALILHENTAAAPVIGGKRFVIGNIYCSLCLNHAGGAAGDTKTAALAQFGAVLAMVPPLILNVTPPPQKPA